MKNRQKRMGWIAGLTAGLLIFSFAPAGVYAGETAAEEPAGGQL